MSETVIHKRRPHSGERGCPVRTRGGCPNSSLS